MRCRTRWTAARRRSACAGTTVRCRRSTSTTWRARSTPRSRRASRCRAASRCCSSRARRLCAIDVDSASAGGRQGRAPRRPVEVNLEAAPAIAQQLRLRNIAGAVVVDFVTMRSAYDRDKVQAALAEALRDDPVPTPSLWIHTTWPFRADPGAPRRDPGGAAPGPRTHARLRNENPPARR